MSGNTLYADAELYDAEFGGYRGDLRFYRRCVQLHPGVVVELGCGTGRLCFELGAAAYVGVDTSPEMLKRFGERAARLGVDAARVVGDAQSVPVAASSAALVILAYNVLQHMMDEAALGRVLCEAARVGGAVALDTFMPPLPGMVRHDEDFGWTEQRRHPGGNVLDVAEQTVLDGPTQIQHTRLRFDDGDPAPRIRTITRRLWAHGALRAAILGAGLQLAELWGDVDGEAWTERSPRFMARCIRV